jgi:hypothetical protein
MATTNLSMLIMHKLPDNRVICKVTWSLGLLAPSIPSFSGICKVKEILLNLIRFKTSYGGCTGKSTENICSSSGGPPLGIKKRQDETQFIIKIAGKTSFGPSYFILETFRSQLHI